MLGHAQHQGTGVALLKLKVEQPALLFHHGAQRHRQQADGFALAAARGHAQHVVAAAGHLQRGQGRAAFAALAVQGDLVAQVVADERLHQVGQVGQKHGVRRLAARHGAVMLVHRLQDQPVFVQVQVAMRAFPGHGQKLRRAIAAAHHGVQAAVHVFARGAAQRFAAGQHAARANAQAPRRRLVGQHGSGRGVRGQHGGLEFVERRHQGIGGLHQAEAVRRLRDPGVEAAQPLKTDDAGKVPARGRHHGGAVGDAQRIERRERAEPPACPAAAPCRCAVPHHFKRVVHGHGLRVLHEHARQRAGARAFPHHVTALPRIAHAAFSGSEVAQLVQAQGRVGHPVVKTVHQLGPRHGRNAAQVRGARYCGVNAFAVKGRAGSRGVQQTGQPLLLALQQQRRGGVGGRDHIQGGGLQVQGVEHGGHGRPFPWRPSTARRRAGWVVILCLLQAVRRGACASSSAGPVDRVKRALRLALSRTHGARRAYPRLDQGQPCEKTVSVGLNGATRQPHPAIQATHSVDKCEGAPARRETHSASPRAMIARRRFKRRAGKPRRGWPARRRARCLRAPRGRAPSASGSRGRRR